MSYADPKSSSRPVIALVAVGIFPVVLIYPLIHGRARKIVEVVRAPLETKIIEEIKRPPPEQQPPPPPPPKLATPPPPFIPPPEVQIQVPVQPAPTITAVVQTPPAVPIPPPAAPVQRTGAVVDAPGCEKPPYPAAPPPANERGIVRLSFLIDVDGRVLESKVERSSGYRRLDEAARAALGACKFRPATVDGRPERAWARIDYDWKIE